LRNISRTDKCGIIKCLHALLSERQQKGPAEPGLDAFIPELSILATRLTTHVTGRVLAEATRETQLARAEEADVDVSTWFRHIESFLFVEANRSSGPNVSLARGLYNAACPSGLTHINERIVEKNVHFAETLTVLKDAENAEAIGALKLPVVYLEAFEAALKESDSAIGEVIEARGDKTTHIDLGRDAEDAWVDLIVRLRRYIESRASRTDAARVAEGKALLKPLLDAIEKLKADAAARATRRKSAGAPKPANPAAQPKVANPAAQPKVAEPSAQPKAAEASEQPKAAEPSAQPKQAEPSAPPAS
jgi:hypothetical protein